MTKRKRVIKVPKAANGLEATGNNWQANMTNKLFGDQLSSLKNDLGNSARMTQLKADMISKNPLGAQKFISSLNQDVPLQNFKGVSSPTAGIAGNLLSAAPQVIDVLANPFTTSTATTGGEAAMQSVADIGKGAATGFQVAGLPGAIVGAAVGLIGKNGKEAEMSSFTDYDSGTLGTGLFGAFRNRKLHKNRRRIENNAYGNRAAIEGTANLQEEWADQVQQVAQGGVIDPSLAYVDDGELIRTPQGQITKVPEEGKPTDSNLVSLPGGSRVLSDTLKVPGTKKTFAQMGEEMMTKRKSKGKDIYAQNAAKLNEMNNQLIYDQLFAQQEQLKAKRGIKKKFKDVTVAYDDGGITDAFDLGNDQRYMSTLPDGSKVVRLTGNLHTKGYQNGQDVIFDGVRYKVGKFVGNPYGAIQGSGGWYRVTPAGNGAPIGPSEYVPVNIAPPSIVEPIQNKPQAKFTNTTPAASTAPPIIATEPLELIEEDYEVQPTFISRTPSISRAPSKGSDNGNDNGDDDKTPFDWAQLATDITALSPVMSNMFTADPEYVRANYNPYANAISNLMSRRRFNIDPALRDLTRNRAINDYNASQMNTNTGANLAFRLQNAVATNNAIANLRAQEDNINNRYRAENANMMNDLGRQFVNASNRADELNAQNRATARNIRRTGLSQLSQYAQSRLKDRNMRRRDKAMLNLYKPFLEVGFTPSDYSYLFNLYNNR